MKQRQIENKMTELAAIQAQDPRWVYGELRKLKGNVKKDGALLFRWYDLMYRSCMDLNKTDEGGELLVQAAEEFERENFQVEKLRIDALQIGHLRKTGQNENIIRLFNRVEGELRKHKLYNELVATHCTISLMYLQEYRELVYARRHAKLALQYSPKAEDKTATARAHFVMGRLAYNEGKVKVALAHYEKAQLAFEKHKVLRMLVVNGNELGLAYRQLEQFDRAIEMFEKVLSWAVELKNEAHAYMALGNLAITSHNKKDDTLADRYVSQMEKKAKFVHDKWLLINSHREISNMYELRNEQQKALLFFKKYQQALQNYQEEYFKKGVQEQKNYLEKAMAEKELAIETLQNEKLQQELEAKRTELNMVAQYVIQKNELIEKFLNETYTAFEQLRLTNDEKRKMKMLLSNMNVANSVNEDLKKFEVQLEQHSIDFIEQLSKKFKQLSASDLKICSLLRINLSNKEIANLLGISVRTVESSRYRISKKLKLKDSAALRAFLQNEIN